MHISSRLLVSLACLSIPAFHCELQAGSPKDSFSMVATEPVAVGKTILPAGIHLWKLLESPSNHHIVQISNAETRQVEAIILAIPNYREVATLDNDVQFWETPKGAPQAVRAWFRPGDKYGDEFPYHKELALSRPMLLARPTPIENTPPPQGPDPQVAARAVKTHAAVSKAPVSSGISVPAGSWAVITGGEPGPTKAPAKTKRPGSIWAALANLPLTATIAPLIGLIGASSLALFLLSFMKRKSRQDMTSLFKQI